MNGMKSGSVKPMNKLRTIARLIGPFAGLIFVFMIFRIIAPSAFYSTYNLKTIVTQSVITGVGAMGMTLVIIAGGIDLSVGSVIALCTVIVARLLASWGDASGALLPLCAATIAVGCGALCGFVNGYLSAGMRIVPFIVTLGTMQIVRGAAKWLGREQTVLAPSTWLNSCMDVDPAPAWLFVAPGVWMLIALAAATALVLRRTVFGRHVFALGSNEAAARLCGIDVVKTRVLIYALCGACTGLAGIMQFANLTVGDPTAAGGMELDIIAAVVIGGGSLAGGEGSALGSLLGAVLMAMLRNGCNLVGIPNYVQNILIGAIIIAAVALDRYKQRAQV